MFCHNHLSVGDMGRMHYFTVEVSSGIVWEFFVTLINVVICAVFVTNYNKQRLLRV